MPSQSDFIRCRTLGHAWDVLAAGDDGTTHLIALQCMSCTTQRFDQVDPFTGDRVKAARYKHAPGYLRSKDATEERPTKSDWRKQFLSVAIQSNKAKRRSKR